MEAPHLVWAASNWLALAGAIALLLLAILVAAYWRAGGGVVGRPVRLAAGSLKLIAILLLAACLLEPLLGGQRARPGANQFVILADNSESMTLKDAGMTGTRGQELKAAAGPSAPWLGRVARDFDLRKFSFDGQLRSVDSFDQLTFDGHASKLAAALDGLLRSYQNQPLAGILLLTDGSATDAAAIENVLARFHGLVPPIYPVLMGGRTPADDVSLAGLAVSQTNFEDAPVTIAAQVTATGMQGKNVVAELLDPAGRPVDSQATRIDKDGQPVPVRFKVKPDAPGISFYSVRVAAEGKTAQFSDPRQSSEATLANNQRIAVVDRGQGPFKILYVSGRPNPDFSFMKRALAADDQVDLTAIIRIARREPKFNFISRDQMNPLFKGFDQTDETTEQFDQPIVMRVTADQTEPRAGFPRTAEELDAYHAVILGDVESEFFTQDQMLLLKDFVRQRGGGLLMLSGEETFGNGKYDRTPIGDVLPVYVDQAAPLPADASYHLALTREGWLEPFLRLRPEEDLETQRLAGMPAFNVATPVRGIKPGATVLARVLADDGTSVPALVEQHFGKGRAAALLVGNLWQWQIRKPDNAPSDYDKAWRQMIRWLVSDVPGRVEIAAQAITDGDDAQAGAVRLSVSIRNESFAPVDNAAVTITVKGPDNKQVALPAEASARKSGDYEAIYVPRMVGHYTASVAASAADGSNLLEEGKAVQTGWASDPSAEEFRDLAANSGLLERLARASGGEMIASSDLERFADSLPTRHAQITESYTVPFWHQSWVFLLAIACLGAEWGLRRWKGLP